MSGWTERSAPACRSLFPNRWARRAVPERSPVRLRFHERPLLLEYPPALSRFPSPDLSPVFTLLLGTDSSREPDRDGLNFCRCWIFPHQTRDGVGGLGAIFHPVLNAVVLQFHRRRLLHRMVRPH